VNTLGRYLRLVGFFAIFGLIGLIGCGVEGESGEYVGTVEQNLGARGAQEVDDGDDRAADGKVCSTICECGRIWHTCGLIINCDYWCGKLEDEESALGCGSGGESEDGRNESIDERDPESDDLGRVPAREPSPAGNERHDADGGDARAADGCYSICPSPNDHIICGPHACTPEAAYSCCPEEEREFERGEEPAPRDRDELADDGNREAADDEELPEDGLREAADEDDQVEAADQALRTRAHLTAQVTFNPRRRVCRVTLNARSTGNVYLSAPAPGASGYLLTRNADRVYRTRPVSYGWSRSFIVGPGNYTASLHATDGRRIYRRVLSQARIQCGVLPRNTRADKVVGDAAERILRSRGPSKVVTAIGSADQ